MATARRGDLLTVDVTDLAFGGEGSRGPAATSSSSPEACRGTAWRFGSRRSGRDSRGARSSASTAGRSAAPTPRAPTSAGAAAAGSSTSATRPSSSSSSARWSTASSGSAGSGDVPVSPILGAPEVYGYRNKMEFTFAEVDGQPVVGLHEAERYDAILDIERCLLQSDGMNAVLAEVRAFVRERRWSVYRQETEEGLLRFLMLREGRQTGDAMVNLVTASPDVATARALADQLRARCPQVTSIVLNVNPKKAAVAVGVEEHPIAGNETIRERLGDLVFSISANSFFQTNTRQAERLFEIVADYAGLTGQETVLDLYAGTGAISLLLARRARAVYGIELVPAAIDDAARNARENGITNCMFLPGEVRHVLPDLLARGVRADVVVADPPRAGFHPKALRSLVTLGPRRIVYVSCNPGTLARDLAILCGAGYRMTAVQPVDMFPHTPHIEVVVRLDRPA